MKGPWPRRASSFSTLISEQKKSGAFQRCAGLSLARGRRRPRTTQSQPKYPLRDLVKLWQEAKQREEEADRRAEH